MVEAIYRLAGKRVYVAGHRGMAGSALVRRLERENCEILTAGREGYAIDPDDTECMARYIGEFFPPERRREASRAARALAEARPIERNFREILAVYQKVLERRTARR